MAWKVATGIAVAVALGALGYTWHAHRMRLRGIPRPPATPTKAEALANNEQNALAALQFRKGSKAVAEASKEAQLGDVRAHDRAAEKELQKGG